MSGITTAAAVIPAISRQRLDDAVIAAAADCFAGFRPTDWQVLEREAVKHRVAPLLHRNVGDVMARFADASAESAARTIAAYSARHAERNSILGSVVQEVLSAAAVADVPIVVRKGAHLALAVYEEPGLRPMGDLDFLVPAEGAGSLTERLMATGFMEGTSVRGGPIEPLTRAKRLFFHLYGADVPQLHRPRPAPQQGVVTLDISTSVFIPHKGFHVPLDDLLERVTWADTQAGPLPVLGAEDVVLDLCVNIHRNLTTLRAMKQGKHRRLINFVDVVEFIARSAFAWPLFLRRVKQYDVVPPVFVALAHIGEMFPDVVPVEVLEGLAATSPDPDRLLRQYGQWELPEPLEWPDSYRSRCFDPERDVEIPVSRSLV